MPTGAADNYSLCMLASFSKHDADGPSRPGPKPGRLKFDIPWEDVAKQVVQPEPKDDRNDGSNEGQNDDEIGEENPK